MAPERVVLTEEKLARAVGDRWPAAQVSEVATLLSRADGRFPAGVRTLPTGLIRAVQRERIVAATIKAATEVGYRSMTVQDVLARAGVSRPTFYQQFEDKEDCFLTAFASVAAEMRERLQAAVSEAQGGDWRARLRAGIAALLDYVATEPQAARAVIVEARASSPTGLRRRDELLDGFAECIDAMVGEELPEPPSALAAAGVVGGVEAVLYARLQRDELKDLEALLPSLMYFATLAYAGQEAARAELQGAALA